MEFSTFNFKDTRNWISFGGLFLIFNGLAIANLSTPKAKDTILMAIVLDALLIAFLISVKAIKIKIDENGVTRKGIFGSTNIPWSEIRSIRRIKHTSLGIELNEQIIVSTLENDSHLEGNTSTTINFNYRKDAYLILQHFSNYINN